MLVFRECFPSPETEPNSGQILGSLGSKVPAPGAATPTPPFILKDQFLALSQLMSSTSLFWSWKNAIKSIATTGLKLRTPPKKEGMENHLSCGNPPKNKKKTCNQRLPRLRHSYHHITRGGQVERDMWHDFFRSVHQPWCLGSHHYSQVHMRLLTQQDTPPSLPRGVLLHLSLHLSLLLFLHQICLLPPVAFMIMAATFSVPSSENLWPTDCDASSNFRYQKISTCYI